MNRDNLKKLSLNLTTNRNDYMSAFRKNIDMYIEQKDITLKEVSELADIPFSTLSSFLYGDTKDCKLSTAVKLARVFDVSIDELVGAGTIEESVKESIALCRNMPDYVTYLIRSFIRHQNKIHSKFPRESTNIPVLQPECKNGYLTTTNITTTICIDHLTDNLRSKICMGIQIPCDHYEPYYMPNEILLLCVDRSGLNNERCVVSYKGNYFIAIKRIIIEDGIKTVKYISILDERRELFQNHIDDKLGYIVGFLNPDGSWGIR